MMTYATICIPKKVRDREIASLLVFFNIAADMLVIFVPGAKEDVHVNSILQYADDNSVLWNGREIIEHGNNFTHL
jgi:hypothetical protein